MALSHAILVSLLDRPQTGYDLGKRFERTVGFFWKASNQQIYQELHKMADAGWVTAETVAQSDRPNRKVYDITDTGRQVLEDWAATPTDPPSVKEELLVKLFALGDINTETILAELRRRHDFHKTRIAYYEGVMREYYPEPKKLKARQRGRYLGLRLGILSEQTSIKWCKEAIDLVSESGSE